MSAPIEPRKRQRSWTCGSQAALPIVVSPWASVRHDDVLGRHHARLVEEDAGPADAVGAHVVRVAGLDLDAQLPEPVDVRIEAAAADHVATGRRDDRGSRPHEEGAGEQERRAHLRAQLRVELGLANVGGVNADVVRADPLDVGAEIVDQREHRVHVPDARDVV